MIKFGKVTEVDLNKGLARVTFPEDELLSHWLPMGVPKSLTDKFSLPYDVNEHVACLMDEHCEEGVIICAIYDSKNAPAVTGHAVGVHLAPDLTIKYERDNKTLTIAGDGIININVSGQVKVQCHDAEVTATTTAKVIAATKITLQAPTVECSGTLTAAVLQISGSISGGGGITATGDVTATGTVSGSQVKEGTVRLGVHLHSGVTTGGGTSGAPVP